MAALLSTAPIAFCQEEITPVNPSAKSDPAMSSVADLDVAVTAATEALDLLETTLSDATTSTSTQDAQRLIEAVRGVDPQTPWLYYLGGRMLALNGRGGDAVASLRKFVDSRVGRNEWRAYRLLGDLFVLEFPRLAQANYDKAQFLKPDEPRVLLGLSRCASMFGQAEKAVRLARQAAAAEGEDPILFVHHLARTLVAAKRWDEARAEALKAVDLARKKVADEPGTVEPLRVLESQYKLIIEILRTRVNDTADSQMLTEAYLQLAENVSERARNTALLSDHEVLQLLEAGIAQAAPSPAAELVLEYAITLARVGRRDDAIAQFERLLTLDPFSAAASEWLERLRGKEPESDGSDGR